jgi:DNA invertase Pin-like site-specific DNA recombinase
MSEKIQPMHTERDACVYIRQSSMQQVRTRLEGQRRQYDLRERAQTLGFQRVIVIDEDLGRSGTGSVERPGFGRLLTAVCSGTVGAVLALEASRLARNNRDWHHLIDLCAMAGTLVIDHDGVYNPSLLNDRLLLGLKGTMSEFEISLLRQRAMEAHRQKVQRGMVLTQVPVGYVRTEDEGIEKTPDRQVQEAIAGVFRKFRELGSARQVFLWYRDEKLLLPALSRESGNRKVTWIEPIYPRIFGILKNPTYAGAFVWGRKHTRTSIVDGRARKTRGHARPQDQWEVVIPEHHEGYITWDEYMRNQQQDGTHGWDSHKAQHEADPLCWQDSCAVDVVAGRCRWLIPTASNMGHCRATGVVEIVGTRWFDRASPSPARAPIRKWPLRSSKLYVLSASKRPSMRWIAARARPMRSDVLWNSHCRRLVMKLLASSGSIRRRSRRTASSPRNSRSDGTAL